MTGRSDNETLSSLLFSSGLFETTTRVDDFWSNQYVWQMWTEITTVHTVGFWNSLEYLEKWMIVNLVVWCQLTTIKGHSNDSKDAIENGLSCLFGLLVLKKWFQFSKRNDNPYRQSCCLRTVSAFLSHHQQATILYWLPPWMYFGHAISPKLHCNRVHMSFPNSETCLLSNFVSIVCEHWARMPLLTTTISSIQYITRYWRRIPLHLNVLMFLGSYTLQFT